MISRTTVDGAYPVKKLGDVADFLDSQRRPVKESERRPGPYPYFGANGQQGTIDGFLFDEGLILLAEDGGFFDQPERGIAYRIAGKSWVNNHAHVLRPKPCVHDGYLCRVLENYDVRPFVTGTTRGKLTKSSAEEIPIPLPTLAEQRRIASILDQADALRAKRRAALAQLDTLTQSIFLSLFGDPVANPRGWRVVRLGDFVTTTSGGTPDRENKDYFGGQIPWVKSGELDADPVVSTGERLTDQGLARSSAKLMPVGTVLVAMYGATVGAISRLGIQAATNQAICCMTPGPGIDAEFLIAFLRRITPTLLERRVGGAQPNLSQELLRNIPLPFPPAPLQEEFSRRILSVKAICSIQSASLESLEALFGSLQHRAFRGEV